VKIVNLELFRRTKQLEAKKPVDIPDDKSESSKPSLSYPEMAKIRDELCTFWNLYNKNDKLDYFFYTTLKIPPKKYSDDLNEIARIEGRLKVPVAVLHPDVSLLDPKGWSAGFQWEHYKIMSPAFPTEQYARMFSLLLYSLLIGQSTLL